MTITKINRNRRKDKKKKRKIIVASNKNQRKLNFSKGESYKNIIRCHNFE